MQWCMSTNEFYTYQKLSYSVAAIFQPPVHLSRTACLLVKIPYVDSQKPMEGAKSTRGFPNQLFFPPLPLLLPDFVPSSGLPVSLRGDGGGGGGNQRSGNASHECSLFGCKAQSRTQGRGTFFTSSSFRDISRSILGSRRPRGGGGRGYPEEVIEILCRWTSEEEERMCGAPFFVDQKDMGPFLSTQPDWLV